MEQGRVQVTEKVKGVLVDKDAAMRCPMWASHH